MSTLTPNELTYPLIPAAIEVGAPRPKDALAAAGVMPAGVRL